MGRLPNGPGAPVSLSGRLGCGPADRLLIVNCDDLGVSHSANVATHEAMTLGIATSATLMVPCPWSREAAELLAGFPVGVHLTRTSEYGDYRWRGLTSGRSLHDAQGFLPATAEAALVCLGAEDAEAECRAQVETALSWGIDVTHLDSHMDVKHGRPDLYEVYLDLAERFRVPVRMVAADPIEGFGLEARHRARARGVLFPDHIIYPWPERTKDVLFEQVPKLAAGVTEVFLHPVQDGDELRSYDQVYAGIRTHDASCLVDHEVRELLDDYLVERISYRELRDAQRRQDC